MTAHINHYSEYYNLFLSILGIIFLLWFVYDINKFIAMINSLTDKCSGLKLVEGLDGEFHIELPVDSERKKIPEYYGFSSGRHSGSYFLKIGAAVFCFGHLIHMGLGLARYSEQAALNDITNNSRKATAYTTHDAEIIDMCSGSELILVHDILYPAYSFLQLYVIYKFGNVIVNKNKILARFAFMHCIGASLCFWIYTIKNETLDAYTEKYFKNQKATECDNEDERDVPYILSLPSAEDPPQCNYTNIAHVDAGVGLDCVLSKSKILKDYENFYIFLFRCSSLVPDSR